MATEHYNFYLFSFDHKGEIETQWQTILRCAECVAQHHQTIEENEYGVIHIDDTSDMWNDNIRVRLIYCATPEERKEHLKICSIMVESFKYLRILDYTPVFAWRCARTPEATVQNFPKYLRLTHLENKEISCFFQTLKWIDVPWIHPSILK